MVALAPSYLEKAGSREQPRGFAGLAGPYDFMPFQYPSTIDAFGSWPRPVETQPVAFVRPGAPPALLLQGVPGQVPKDVPRAARYLRAAAAVGDLMACFNLGKLLLHGDEGVPQDAPGALPLLRKAADSGDTDAARVD